MSRQWDALVKQRWAVDDSAAPERRGVVALSSRISRCASHPQANLGGLFFSVSICVFDAFLV